VDTFEYILAGVWIGVAREAHPLHSNKTKHVRCKGAIVFVAISDEL
jgi:hypothetical protein